MFWLKDGYKFKDIVSVDIFHQNKFAQSDLWKYASSLVRNLFTHIWPMSPFYTFWKHQKT